MVEITPMINQMEKRNKYTLSLITIKKKIDKMETEFIRF